MAYLDDPRGTVMERAAVVPAAVDYHDRVRWGPILAGLAIAISSQLVLSALAAAIGLTSLSGSGAPRSNAGSVGTAVGISAIISLFISLFLGGWVTSRACGPINRSTALLNGAILWATTLAISGWLLSSGVSGAFGVVASNAGEVLNQAQQSGITPGEVTANAPNITAQQARDLAGNAAKIGWSFALGSLLGLVAALIGATVGNRPSRTTVVRSVDTQP
ncbi:hypothetical protein [Leptodesmis sichuanensis]|uniref:hypothetical protein n=1 Tax=Leptodesmis sichuanensis TaxID=2906798 RepID=UPI001F316FE6|nr:hypothetical protein [Leptodesmis sichuanensis]UIE39504.1 hypothetical protein KIK02_08080 [Leptodesmis sichuanensis A121]